MLDYAPLNESIMATFGELQVTGAAPVFITPTGDRPLDAVLEEHTSAENIGAVGIHVNGKSLMMPETAFTGQGIEARQRVIVRGKTYAIKAVGPDIDGMVTLPITEVGG